MSVKLNRPTKPEESQKNSNFNGKTIPYPGFEPGTSGLAVGRHNHCTIWVSSLVSTPKKKSFLSQINTEISVLKNLPGSWDISLRDPGFECPKNYH
jgi:hypothetical protein